MQWKELSGDKSLEYLLQLMTKLKKYNELLELN